jgi:hypothetical protein
MAKNKIKPNKPPIQIIPAGVRVRHINKPQQGTGIIVENVYLGSGHAFAYVQWDKEPLRIPLPEQYYLLKIC